MPTRLLSLLRRAAAAIALFCISAAPADLCYAQGQPNAVPIDGVAQLMLKIEAAVGAGSAPDFLALSTLKPDDPDVRAFLDRWLVSRTTRAAVRERDRVALDGGGARVMVEALIEAGSEGRLATWTLEMAPSPDGTWRLTKATTSGIVDGLYHLELDSTRAFRAHDLVVAAEDFELHLPAGDVFVAMAGGRISAAVLMGRGTMTFHPTPDTERRQVELFCGREALATQFNWAFLRLSPGEAETRLPPAQLTPSSVDKGMLSRAREVFAEQLPKSFGVELADLSRLPWSLVPTPGDFLAEVDTGKYGTLTYANADNDQEDITVFNREHHRNIAVYMSAARRAAQSQVYNEDDSTEYDVQDYQVDNSFIPERFWMEGRTTLKIKVRAYALSALTFKLAEPLFVQSVTSDQFGRLLALRVRGQSGVVLNLPTPAHRGDVLTLTVKYSGRLEPQGVDRENIGVQVLRGNEITPTLEPERSYVYSNRHAWYAQGSVSDYATATIRLTIPAGFGAACSGEPASGSPVSLKAAGEEVATRRLFVFTAPIPLRYLGCVVSRFIPGDSKDVSLQMGTAADAGTTMLPIRLVSSARQRGRSRDVLTRAADIASFYTSLMHDVPYSSLNLAVVESNVPGGHSPAYLVVLNQPLPTTPFVWRDDPAAFDEYPDFFIAHEMAHQWWGQAVGWKNYHEQWLSEGLSQYFAVLYAEHQKGPQVFGSLLRQLTKWAEDTSDQGPVYLGYRLGYLKGGGRTFRALVYNKAAIVVHMLRRMLGDETFFKGLRRFYTEHRFEKAGIDDFQHAFEAESGQPLGRFFERWILGQDLPQLTSSFTAAPDGASVTVSLKQVGPKLFDFPVTVTLLMADGTTEDHTVVVGETDTQIGWPLKGRLKGIALNRDRLTPMKR
jgi:peptidase M1-like protein